jgi:hypothetical protein
LGTVNNVEADNPIGQFLRARRELVQPEDVGIEAYGAGACRACAERSSPCWPV